MPSKKVVPIYIPICIPKNISHPFIPSANIYWMLYMCPTLYHTLGIEINLAQSMSPILVEKKKKKFKEWADCQTGRWAFLAQLYPELCVQEDSLQNSPHGWRNRSNEKAPDGKFSWPESVRVWAKNSNSKLIYSTWSETISSLIFTNGRWAQIKSYPR